jgi:hypothetical protein
MDRHGVQGHRRMVRSFVERPVEPRVVDELMARTLGAPTAGNTGGTAWVVLSGPAETAGYWARTTTDGWRSTSRRWPGLSRAPVVALSLTSPRAYVERYGEPDKRGSGLGPATSGGGGGSAWPVPYWFGDAAFATMALLEAAADAGLGACFLGNFRGETALMAHLAVPAGWRLFGSVLIGHPDGGDHRSASLDRTPLVGPRLHYGRWLGAAGGRVARAAMDG